MEVHITHIDTACVLIEINGYRVLTDPTLDNAGHLYYHGSGSFSRKTGNPSLPEKGLGHIDLVLLSHHQHKDNLDNKGLQLMLSGCLVLSTRQAAKAIKGITGLDDWQSYKVNTPKVPGFTITATPAQHHPWWVPEFLTGKVIGFIIQFEGQTNGAIYISGDTVYFKGIEEIAKRFKIDVGIFNLGSVQFRYLTGFGKYTMDGAQFLRTTKLMNPRTAIPLHYSGWSHFKEDESTLRKLIADDKQVSERTLFLVPGKQTLLAT